VAKFINKPLRMFLQAEVKHAYCACGKSESFPMCDGSHRGSDAKPIKFFVDKDEEVLLCQCGKSKKLPYCDGSHTK